MAKNIVVLSDGTGKDGGKGYDTNVYKLFRMLEDRTAEQVVFYDRGLGTDWRRLTGNAFGAGISQNVLECYRFIFDHFTAGDRIYLFGFSRGAFTVRSLSGFMHLVGILPQSRPELIEPAWKIYRRSTKTKTKEQRRARLAAAFVDRHGTMWAKIAFLGVWDTVGTLGFPYRRVAAVLDRVPWFQNGFHSTRMRDSVERGCHALAIDDERLSFHPTFWDEPDPRVEQVWFAGMHSDVGGGYGQSGLSDIALQWMVRRAVPHGLRLYSKHRVKGAPDPAGLLHDSRDGIGALYRRQRRAWPYQRSPAKIHASVVERMRTDGQYRPWIAQGEVPAERVVEDGNDIRVFAS